MRKTFLSCLLALSMIISLLPTTAIADGGLLMSAGASGGTTYYVSETGNDTADGTDEAAPLKTITKAYSKAADGDTICLLSDIKIVGKLVLTDSKEVTLAGNAGEAAPTIKYSWDGVTTNNLYMIEIGAESGTSTQTNITLRNLTVDAEAQDSLPACLPWQSAYPCRWCDCSQWPSNQSGWNDWYQRLGWRHRCR